jgi:hypothetical protein
MYQKKNKIKEKIKKNLYNKKKSRRQQQQQKQRLDVNFTYEIKS